MSRLSAKLLVMALCVLALNSPRPGAAEDRGEGKGIALELGKVEEAEATPRLGEPNYGYVGDLGSFVATKDANALALIAVHRYPDTETASLGRTKLTYEGPKRLGNVDGWVFRTEWDGIVYPSKIFFSSEKVYFGGGVNSYIAADYRENTGWAWKLRPLRRMGLVTK
ncbi:MAG: hypothetical protein JOZ53_05475 [Planctomycetaceae bacterium]|jgi:hypothetical protein|nr:hypothetical protein [Planctomycetaceae bacterium]